MWCVLRNAFHSRIVVALFTFFFFLPFARGVQDVENYKEFVSSALENAGVKVSSKPLFLDSHQKALEEDKAWSDAVSYENGGELCISCWNPEENTLSWNSGMFRLFGCPLPEDASEEGNDSYTLYRGGDLTCTTNRLPSSTRNHFYKAANESVRMGSEFECLHELYSYGQDGQLGSQFVLNHAKQQGKIWIGVIQVISTDLLRCLRDNAAMNSVVSSFVLNTSQNMMNVIQMEVGRFFELTQMNALCGVVNGLDLDDYELDDDDDDDDDNQDSLMLANDSTDDGSWIDGFQRLDYLDSFYLNHIRKVYASSFPQAINAVLKVAQKRCVCVCVFFKKSVVVSNLVRWRHQYNIFM